MSSFDPTLRTFVRGAGTQLFDSQGKATFDAVSSIWTTVHGHCRPEITEAITRQARELDHATALGASNPVAERLAERLCALTGLNRAFFASDGASAVEAALKMALQFWQQTGAPERTRFLHLSSSYHGDTAGAMSVSAISAFRERFSALCFETLTYDRLDPETLHRPDLAAIIVEPLVQAAAGMRVIAPAAYHALTHPLIHSPAGASAVSQAPLFIVDEIATGFGRTGTLFAHEQLGLRPDLLCLGKGITGGALALSATLTNERVFSAFLDAGAGVGADQDRRFFHGHSYAANPIACAAALASLELFERENTLEHVAMLTRHLARLATTLREDPRIAEVRQVGLMCGIQVYPERVTSRPHEPTPAWGIAGAMYERGHFTRPIGDVVQLVPPLTTTPRELDAFAQALIDSL